MRRPLVTAANARRFGAVVGIWYNTAVANQLDGLLVVLLGVGALLLRAGAALRAAGGVRSKNAASAAVRTAFDFILGTLAFWAVGAAILAGKSNGFFGLHPGLLLGRFLHEFPDWLAPIFFHLTVVLIAAGIVTEAVAERSRFRVGAVLTLALAAFIVPVGAHWAWYGWLKERGFLDVGGASFIHLAGAVVAVAAAALIGPRTGKYNRDGSVNMIPGHNITLNWTGLALTLVGTVPYVVGCTVLHGGSAPLAALNVLLSAAAGGLAAFAVSYFRYGKADVFLLFSGVFGGLVAITAGAGVVETWAAVVIGGGAGLLVPLVTLQLDLLTRIDDPAGSIGIHGAGGLWGLLAAGALAPSAFAERARLLGVQAVGAACVALLALAVASALLVALRATGPLRHGDDAEFDGLDLSEHDINAYPDFQQTTIKSYHLREQ